MPKARIDAATHARLRELVITHNEAGVGPKTKVGELQKVFRQGWWGENPAATALARVERHLKRLAKAADFDPAEHPRDDGGRFSAFRDVASRAMNRRLKDENDGYRASQTQVIPETRFSTFGPVAGAALGIGVGIRRGAAPGAYKQLDRVTHGAMAAVAGKAGKILARPVLGLAGVASDAARRASGKAAMSARERLTLNRARAADVERVTRKAVRAGLDVTQQVLDAPARAYHKHKRSQIRALNPGRLERVALHAQRVVGGAAIGAVVPGTLYAYGNAKTMETVGPYLDSAFPRKVEKLAKVSADARSVALLSRHHAITPSDLVTETRLSPLAKIEADPRALGVLAKASLGGFGASMGAIGRAALGRLRGMGGAAAGAAASHTPGVARAATGAGRAARLRSQHLIGGSGKVLAALGGAAAAGGVAAGGTALAERVYYRDKDGQFTSREKAVAVGAGALAGALGGLAFVRHANLNTVRRLASEAALGRTYPGVKASVRAPGTGTPIETADDVRITPQQVAQRAGRMAANRLRADKHREIETAKAAAAGRVRTMREAAGQGPVEWNDWQVRRELDKRLRRTLSEPAPGTAGHSADTHAFWEPGQGGIRNRVIAAARRGDAYDHLLNPRQQAQLGAMRAQAADHQADYARRVAEHQGKVTGAKEARDKAIALHDAAKSEHATAQKARKELEGMTDEPYASQRASHAETEVTAGEAMRAAAKERDVAAGRLRELEAEAKNPADLGNGFPKPRDPWGTGFLPAAPSPDDLAKTEKEMVDEALARVEAQAKKRAVEVELEVNNLSAATSKALREMGSSPPGPVGQVLSDMAGAVAPHLARARRDARRLGGSVKAAVQAKLGTGPDRFKDYAAKAGAKATDFTLGAKGADGKRAGGVGRKVWENRRLIIGTGLAVGSAVGAVDHYDDGRFKIDPKKAKDFLGSVRKNPPQLVNRVFNPGDPKAQVILTGVVAHDKKTGQSLFLSGTIKRGTDPTGPEEEVPLNARLEDVLRQLRPAQPGGGQGSGPKPQVALDPAQAKPVDDALKNLRAAGKLGTFGEDDLTVEHRTDPAMHQAEAEVVKRGLFADAGKRSGPFGGGFDPGSYYQHLGAVIEADRSSLLSLTQRAALLTGLGGKGVFSAQVAQGFRGENNQTLYTAMKKEFGDPNVPNSSKVPWVRDDDQVRNLKRAVRVISERADQAVRVTPNQMADLDRVIEAHRRPGGAPGGSAGGNAGGGSGGGSGGGTPGGGGPKPNGGGGASSGPSAAPPRAARPSREEQKEAAIQRVIDTLASAYNRDDPVEKYQYETTAANVRAHWRVQEPRVRESAEKRPGGFDEASILEEVANHILDSASRGGKGRQKAQKSVGAGLLRKRGEEPREPAPVAGTRRPYDEQKHARAPKGNDRGGEFAPRGGGGQGRDGKPSRHQPPPAGQGRDGKPSRHQPQPGAARPPGQQAEGDPRGYFEPVRLGAKLGQIAGGQAGWDLAARYLPGPLKTKGAIARLAFRLAAAGVAGAVGGAVGQRTGAATYAVRGQTAPGAYEEPQRPGGEEIARAAGGLAGGLLGGATGNPVAAFALGAAGQLGGEELAGAVHRAIASRFGADVAARAGRGVGGAAQPQPQTQRPVG